MLEYITTGSPHAYLYLNDGRMHVYAILFIYCRPLRQNRGFTSSYQLGSSQKRWFITRKSMDDDYDDKYYDDDYDD